MSLQRRLERLEIEAHRRHVTRYVPAGMTLDQFLDKAIDWLQMPLDSWQSSMPMFTAAEHAEIASWLPRYRRMRIR